MPSRDKVFADNHLLLLKLDYNNVLMYLKLAILQHMNGIVAQRAICLLAPRQNQCLVLFISFVGQHQHVGVCV